MRLHIDPHRRHAKAKRTFRLLDRSAVGEELPERWAEQLADAVHAATTRRALVRHYPATNTARVCSDQPPNSRPRG